LDEEKLFFLRRNELHAHAVREATVKVYGRQEEVVNVYVNLWM